MKYRLTCNLCGKVVYETRSPSMVATWGELADHDWIVHPQVDLIVGAWALHLLLSHEGKKSVWAFKGEVVDFNEPGE